MAQFEGPTRGPQLLAAIWSLVILSAIFLLLRIYCKVNRARGLWYDDWVLVAAWICLFGPAICMIPAVVNLGFGHHFAVLDPATIPTIMYWVGIGGSPTIIAVELSKSSFALTLVKLFNGSKIRWFLWFAIVTICLFMTMSFVVMYVRCTPVKRNWDITIEGTCWDNDAVTAYSMFAAGYSALMDFLLALLPWKLLRGLQMKTREKIGVGIAMSMGVFAGITSAIKTYYLSQLMSMDFSYDAYDLQVWGYAETAVTIIAASIPVLRVLVRETSKAYGSGRGELYKLSATGRHTSSTKYQTTSRRVSRGVKLQDTFGTGTPTPDDLSDKSIVRVSRKDGILQTTEVKVHYSDRSVKAMDSESDIIATAV